MIRSIVSGSSSGRLMVFYRNSFEITLTTDVNANIPVSAEIFHSSTLKKVRQNGDNGTMNVKSLPLAGYCRVRVVPLQENFHHFLVRWL